MSAVGTAAPRVGESEAIARSRLRAALLPDLLVEARRIAHTAQAGWHGRRRRGIGEEFWQFRPFQEGETFSRIDWRRSARDDQLYVRDLEWQAAHTVWLWADPSPSMLYKSRMATVSKESRALVLALALADVLSRSGERIAVPGVLAPVAARNAAERMAAALAREADPAPWPDLSGVRRYNDVVLVSDFLEPVDYLAKRLEPLAARGVRVHLVEVADPAEEDFPYGGRTEFRDPESGERLVIGRAADIAANYRRLYLEWREERRLFAARRGWTHAVTRTDRLASETLVRLHLSLSESREGG